MLLPHDLISSLKGAEMLYPPHRRCPDPTCQGSKLGNAVYVEARLYTLHRGVLPVYSISLNCSKCNTRYHPNHSVTNPKSPASQRQFYADVGSYIHVNTTVFLEDQLCEFFEQNICHSHSSSTILARLYNLRLGRTHTTLTSTLKEELTQEMVLDAFFLYALLRHNIVLRVPHHGQQEHRLDDALHEANQRMAGTGQPQYAHACDQCLKVISNNNGEPIGIIHGGVTDGVTLGHTCCRVKHCKVPLRSVKDWYCPEHLSLTDKCHVEGCIQLSEAPYITCNSPEHRVLEDEARQRQIAKSLHLDEQQRLQKDGVPTASGKKKKHKGKGKSGKRDIHGMKFTRNYTHNEQLFIFCCGVIVSRCTFFVAEGPENTQLFQEYLKRTFPHPALIPTHLFYDNACTLWKFLRAHNDPYWDAIRLVVDVFHSHVHSDEDDVCQANCVPTLFPELKTADGKWQFNSSIAEQTNVWFGVFQSMARELSSIRYNFFLDEMISIRNEWMVEQLAKKQQHPWLRDLDAIMKEYEEK
ncbi:hypothetical protein BDZ89DRAFT_966423 [Hymenopellis radicata]|nr:hypothetical protein BDZ89DRAFT_966423 [Hymenopellis radicata]